MVMDDDTVTADARVDDSESPTVHIQWRTGGGLDSNFRKFRDVVHMVMDEKIIKRVWGS